jgi:hypothetical protein
MARGEYLKNSSYSINGSLCLDEDENIVEVSHATNCEHLINNTHCDGETADGEEFEVGVSKNDDHANDEIYRVRDESFKVNKGGHTPWERQEPVPESYWDQFDDDDQIVGDDEDE